ncbi:trehalose monomycolate transport factor TtfA [Tsukamurella serpentis]
MSYVVFLILAVVCAVLAAALIWYERNHTPQVRSERADWAAEREFVYTPEDPSLQDEFHRGGMAVGGAPKVIDVAHGAYFGAAAYVFDVQGSVTVVAIDRGASSGALMDLRPGDAPPPGEPGMEPLGALGPRVLYTNNAEVARRVADRRMITFAEQVPEHIESLWNEGEWTLAAMPTTDDPEDLDEALEAVRRFGDLLRVLPPEGHARVLASGGPRDPGQPLPVRSGPDGRR